MNPPIEKTTETSQPSTLTLGIDGYTYGDLYDNAGLRRLHEEFGKRLKAADGELWEQYLHAHKNKDNNSTPQALSELLIAVAPHLSRFIGELFTITAEQAQQADVAAVEHEVVSGFRKRIIKPALKALKRAIPSPEALQESVARIDRLRQFDYMDMAAEDKTSDKKKDEELEFCQFGSWLHSLETDTKEFERLKVELGEDSVFAEIKDLEMAALSEQLQKDLQHWLYFIANSEARLEHTWVCFKTPQKTDFNDLVAHKTKQQDGVNTWVNTTEVLKRRDGFVLTDKRYNERHIQYEVDHCIYCHNKDTDSCSKGMRNKKTGEYIVNPLGVTPTGCPLEEKISEMHILKKQGDAVGALAIVMIDNPMCPGTGHRICNDCMKACIYQKTAPVNIPQIETNVFTDVLFLAWGFEIYGLLSRWNPLNFKRPYALAYNGKKILVVGMGPAGYTLAHYLLNEGFGVVGIDALKLEPLPDHLVGSDETLPQPLDDFMRYYDSLDERVITGFGGVAEYGITSRWDKNFLKVIYLTLLRRRQFKCFGGVRFGGTLTVSDAWRLGFDHIAVATGAGKPTVIPLKNNLMRGIRKASDFLMALQLTGAAKPTALSNLQLRLPVGIIGGGLTAIDTTTEAIAYYPLQVERILSRYEALCQQYDVAEVRSRYDEEELIILDEFLEHGQAIRVERARAVATDEKPNFLPLIEAWGGVTLFYRRAVKDSPAYRQNHEEIGEALAEGIKISEYMSPLEAVEDSYGALQAVKFNYAPPDTDRSSKTVPLKSLLVAAGTSPNTIYEQEYPDTFVMHDKFFQRYEPQWNEGDIQPSLVSINDEPVPKRSKPAPFTSYCEDGKFISFYGDNHPVYAGNVVKAMASAKDGYPYVARLFENELCSLDEAQQGRRDRELANLFAGLSAQFEARVVGVNRLASNIVELIVKAPMAAAKFQPGQFYRVQNLESNAVMMKGHKLIAEGLALTGAGVDKERGLISLITLEMGSSSKLCSLWQEGERIIVMGVTGEPTQIGKNKTVMLIGGGLGNAVQFSIGKALRAVGNKVIYFAGYRRGEDVFKVDELEQAADIIVWAVDSTPEVSAIPTTRHQDKSYVGNILEAIERYAEEEQNGQVAIDLKNVDHMIVIGSDRMMKAVKEARYGRLKPYLKPDHTAIGSINSPMQCMMKGVCAQCLCKHIDPDTGENYFVYSCYNQDQELDRVDFDNLHGRLKQNSVQEKLSDLWLDHLIQDN